MTERISKKAKIEALLQAGKAPAQIAEVLGVARRYAVAVAWRIRDPEREKAIKRAGRERLTADEEWYGKERERSRKRDKEPRKERTYRRARANDQRRWRMFKKVRVQAQRERNAEGY